MGPMWDMRLLKNQASPQLVVIASTWTSSKVGLTVDPERPRISILPLNSVQSWVEVVAILETDEVYEIYVYKNNALKNC